jgi:hypothetical protein
VRAAMIFCLMLIGVFQLTVMDWDEALSSRIVRSAECHFSLDAIIVDVVDPTHEVYWPPVRINFVHRVAGVFKRELSDFSWSKYGISKEYIITIWKSRHSQSRRRAIQKPNNIAIDNTSLGLPNINDVITHEERLGLAYYWHKWDACFSHNEFWPMARDELASSQIISTIAYAEQSKGEAGIYGGGPEGASYPLNFWKGMALFLVTIGFVMVKRGMDVWSPAGDLMYFVGSMLFGLAVCCFLYRVLPFLG